jgi:tetratricopeptide (TPR) repeat protein
MTRVRCFVALVSVCVLGLAVAVTARADDTSSQTATQPALNMPPPASSDQRTPPAAPKTEAQLTCDKLAAAPVPLSPQARHPDQIDWQQAITACTEAIKDDPKEARYEYELGHAYEQTKNYAEALIHYKAAADANNGDGLQALGLMYFKGLGTVVDKEKAFVLWYRGAEAGNAVALENLGAMFGNGDFVQRDDNKHLSGGVAIQSITKWRRTISSRAPIWATASR